MSLHSREHQLWVTRVEIDRVLRHVWDIASMAQQRASPAPLVVDSAAGHLLGEPVSSAEEDCDDGDGDYVPRATTMRLRGTSPAPAPRRKAGARLRTRSSSNGGIITAAAAAGSVANNGPGNGTGGAALPNGDTDTSDGGGGGGGGRHLKRPKDEPGELHESRSGSPMDQSSPDANGSGQQQQQQEQQQVPPFSAVILALHS